MLLLPQKPPYTCHSSYHSKVPPLAVLNLYFFSFLSSVSPYYIPEPLFNSLHAKKRVVSWSYTVCGPAFLFFVVVVATDLQFTETVLGRPVPFATAGDCYSAAKCPQVRPPPDHTQTICGWGVTQGITGSCFPMCQTSSSSDLRHKEEGGCVVACSLTLE